MSSWHPGRMLSDQRDRHDQANAEQIGLLKAALRPMEPWDGADEDAPLADPRPRSSGRASGALEVTRPDSPTANEEGDPEAALISSP